jgi:asparagine synthase (glutamine-hydrolysing)
LAALRTIVRGQAGATGSAGILLSSGLDSSLIAELARHHTDVRTCTVSCVQDGSPHSNDETTLAEAFADERGLRHTTVTVDRARFLRLLEKALPRVEEPNPDPTLLLLLAVAEEAAPQVQVMLSGDGADELFGGYMQYRRAAAGRRRWEPGRPVRSLVASGDLGSVLGPNSRLDGWSAGAAQRPLTDTRVPLTRMAVDDLRGYMLNVFLHRSGQAFMAMGIDPYRP